jgi:WD40 repeat protein/class 3 adenylate cyclase
MEGRLSAGASVDTAAPAAIPSGTVTFLFTDIEGSTRLLEQLREAYADVLADQRDLLRALFERWNGFEVDTQCDSFFVAFPRASDALRCTIDAQRAIAAHDWPAGIDLRVRMALHSGEPLIARTGYVGIDVHRAARIGSAGHGGQIVVSQTTRELLGADLAPDIELVSLGGHSLRDVRQPVELYQVRADGLATDFPPLRTLETGDEPARPGEPPFKGLEYFDEADAPLFFGRERLTEELIERLDATRFLAVVGASGSGKSSLVRAGLIPALRARRSPRWAVRMLTPGARPLEELEQALGGERAQGHRLLVVDQFEELFTLVRDPAERDQFIAGLLSAIEADDRLTVLLTLRADFYDRIAAYERLRAAVADNQAYIGPMSRDELRRAIEGPAEAGDWGFSPGLVDLILHDVGEEPGALPLLSHALLETWRRRRRNVMTLKSYAESGGVRGAIARTADRVFNAELDPIEQSIARSLFLRLTELGEGAQDTRRRAALAEIVPRAEPAASRTQSVLGRLVDARLVTLGEGSAEVAHEALIREWPRLREWLSEDREGLRVHRQLTEATQEWELLDRDPGALYRGARLANALEWAAANADALNEQERAFLDASREQQAHEEAEREEQQRRELEAAEALAASEAAAARRLRRRAVLLSGALVLAVLMAAAAVVLGVLSQQSADEAQRNFAEAESQRLAAESSTLLQLSGSSELAALLALRGLEADYTPQADMALQRASRADYGSLVLHADRQIDTLAVSPDGALVATMSRDGMVRLWSLSDGQLVGEYDVGAPFAAVAFTPDGRQLAVCSEKLAILDVQSMATVLGGEGGFDCAYSPDGSELFIARGDHVAVLDPATAETTLRLEIETEGLKLIGSDRLLTARGLEAQIHDARSGALLHSLAGHDNAVNGLAVSADGRYAATASWDETAKVWDTSTGSLVSTLAGHTEILFRPSFSPNGRWLLTGSLDNTARLWDVASGRELRRLSIHTAAVYEAAFTPDGRHAITVSADRTARVWDLDRPLEAGTLAGQESFVYAVDFSPDGRLIFTGSADLSGRLWDAQTLTQRALPYEDSRVDRADFSPDGRLLLLAHESRPAELWDVVSGRSAGELPGSAGGLTAGFSADGRLIVATAAIGEDGTAVGLWDATSRLLLRTFDEEGGFSAGAISPDGRYVAVARDETEDALLIFDAATGEQLHAIENGSSATTPTFSADSRHLLTGSRDNTGRIVDVETGAVTELVGHTNIIWGTAFSPDGRLALTGSQDRTARLWDVATGQELRRFASHQYSAIAGVEFSPDGGTIAIGNFDGYTQLTAVDLDVLHDSVCQRVLRDFEPVERQIYEIPDDAPTCGGEGNTAP